MKYHDDSSIQDYIDNYSTDILTRFEKIAKIGRELTQKLGLNEEQIIQICLEVKKKEATK